MLAGVEQELMAQKQAPTSAFDWPARSLRKTVFAHRVSDPGIEIGLFARELLKLFEFVETELRLV
jgi:hypothetical protein